MGPHSNKNLAGLDKSINGFSLGRHRLRIDVSDKLAVPKIVDRSNFQHRQRRELSCKIVGVRLNSMVPARKEIL
jgi:hypothetical protein